MKKRLTCQAFFWRKAKMKKTNKKFWLAALLTAAVLTGVSGCGEITTPSSSLTERSTETTAEQTQAETTAAPEETAETTDTKTTAAETLPAQESSETHRAPGTHLPMKKRQNACSAHWIISTRSAPAICRRTKVIPFVRPGRALFMRRWQKPSFPVQQI